MDERNHETGKGLDEETVSTYKKSPAEINRPGIVVCSPQKQIPRDSLRVESGGKMKTRKQKRLMQTRKMSRPEVSLFIRRVESFTNQQLKTLALLANSILAEREEQ